jgi:mRNA interferase MazF
MTEEAFQWRVFRAVLDPVIGSEQAGLRPVLVVSDEIMNEALSIVTVLPLTSAKPGRNIYSTEVLLPAGVAGQPADSIVMAHQIRTISKQRLRGAYGSLDDPMLRQAVRAAMRLYLNLENWIH